MVSHILYQHDAVSLQFTTMVSHTRTRSSLVLVLDSFLYILNFEYFRFFFFILDLGTICIIYISLLYCSFLGTIQRMVPRALLDASRSSYTNFFSVYVYTSLTVLEKTVINKTYKVIILHYYMATIAQVF